MRPINLIIIHCSATPANRDIGAKEIRQWHLQRTPPFKDIGYHYVIRRNGDIETGRLKEIAGSHTQGHNAHSLGICLIGGVNEKMDPQNNFTPNQIGTLERLLRILKADYPKATIHGHNEYSTKACPSFDVQEWLKERAI